MRSKLHIITASIGGICLLTTSFAATAGLLGPGFGGDTEPGIIAGFGMSSIATKVETSNDDVAAETVLERVSVYGEAGYRDWPISVSAQLGLAQAVIATGSDTSAEEVESDPGVMLSFIGRGVIAHGDRWETAGVIYAELNSAFDATLSSGGSSRDLAVDGLMEIGAALLGQYHIVDHKGATRLYGGPLIYILRAKWEEDLGGSAAPIDARYEESSNFGAIMGVSVPLTTSLRFQLEGRYQGARTLGASLIWDLR
jgi:hypothetical protein